MPTFENANESRYWEIEKISKKLNPDGPEHDAFVVLKKNTSPKGTKHKDIDNRQTKEGTTELSD